MLLLVGEQHCADALRQFGATLGENQGFGIGLLGSGTWFAVDPEPVVPARNKIWLALHDIVYASSSYLDRE